MSPSTLRRAAAAVVASLLLAACAGGDPEPAASPRDVSTIGQPTSPSPEPSPTPTEIDVTTIPDEITLEYAQAVIDTIYGEYGAIVAEVVSRPAGLDNEITEAQFDRLFAIFEGEALTFRVEDLTELAIDEGARDGLLPAEDFTGQSFRLLRLVEADPSCIVAIAEADLTGSTGEGVLDVYSALSLAPAEGEGLTAWRVLQGVTSAEDAERKALFLDATLADFGDALVTTCGGSR